MMTYDQLAYTVLIRDLSGILFVFGLVVSFDLPHILSEVDPRNLF